MKPKTPQIFKSEDFDCMLTPAGMVMTAQEILQSYLAEHGTVIYGQLPAGEHVWNTKNPEWHDTHMRWAFPAEEIRKQTDTKYEGTVIEKDGKRFFEFVNLDNGKPFYFEFNQAKEILKECEHEPFPLDMNATYKEQQWECAKCGVKLKAKFEAVEG